MLGENQMKQIVHCYGVIVHIERAIEFQADLKGRCSRLGTRVESRGLNRADRRARILQASIHYPQALRPNIRSLQREVYCRRL